MTIGFGLDLAGFTNHRGTVLAAIRADNKVAKVTILTDAPFSGILNATQFPKRLTDETEALDDLLKIGLVAVDVPIDLQGLPVRDAKESWELTLRPVDKEFRALPALASWLGACVARFDAILSPRIRKQLGSRLFETYPAASLAKLFCKDDPDVRQYKLSDKKKSGMAVSARARLSKRIKIDCDTASLSHDDLDAIICAVTAVASDDDLLPLENYGLNSAALPCGYRVLAKNPFDQIRVSKMNYNDWMKDNSGSA